MLASTLLYVFLLVPTLTAAWTPKDHKTSHVTRAKDAYGSRQVSRNTLVARSLVKTRRAKIQALRTEHAADSLLPPTRVHRQYPRASETPGGGGGGPPKSDYPQCKVTGVNGYARYPGWDLVRDDLDGNPHYTQDRTEAESIALCDARTDCAGAVILIGGPSYLKGFNIQSGEFQLSPHSEPTVLDLVGTCADWKQYVSADQDAACCES